MTMGINPMIINELSMYEIDIYLRLIPLYAEYQNQNMENSIKKAIAEIM